MNKVTILMSTYNGEKYIEQQIESILNQQGVIVDLLIRDDGSTDGTVNIIKKIKKKTNNVHILETTNNVGVRKSFMELLKKSGDSDFYALSDQDDVWLNDKMLDAISSLDKLDKNEPALYFSKTRMVDQDLNNIGFDSYDSGVFDLGKIVVKNNCVGCTMVFNNTLKKIINKVDHSKIEVNTLHDHWIYLLCGALNGNIIYSSTPKILYRQHSNNVVGGNSNLIKKITKNALFSKEKKRSSMVKVFYNAYSNDISGESEMFLLNLINYDKSFYNKFKFAFNKSLNTSNLIERIILAATILRGRF